MLKNFFAKIGVLATISFVVGEMNRRQQRNLEDEKFEETINDLRQRKKEDFIRSMYRDGYSCEDIKEWLLMSEEIDPKLIDTICQEENALWEEANK